MDNCKPGTDMLALVTEARAFLEPRWISFQRDDKTAGEPISTPSSKNMCRLSARFLLHVLEEAFPDDEWSIVGGAATPGEDTCGQWGGKHAGMQDTRGLWHGHYWLENLDGLVVDITADQFDWEPVIVIQSDDGGYARYRANYADWALQEHMRRVAWMSSVWLNEWKHRNDASPAPTPC